MTCDTVRIDHLRLHVPGVAPGDARRFAEEVVRTIVRDLPVEGRREMIGTLQLKVVVPAGATHEELVQAIARRVVETLS